MTLSFLFSGNVELFLKNIGVFHIKNSPSNLFSTENHKNLILKFKNYLKTCFQHFDFETNIYKFNLSYNSSKHCA